MLLHFIKDYRDRYGVEHKAGEEAELRDHIAAKVVHYRIANVVSRPMASAPVEVEDISPAVFVADMVEQEAEPGEPLPDVTGEMVAQEADEEPAEEVAPEPVTEEAEPVKRGPGRPRKS